MIHRVILIVLLALGLLLVAGGEAAQPAAAAVEEVPQLIRMAPQAAKAPARALALSLLPDPLDQVSGNAAPLWLRASLAARNVRYKWTDREYKWDRGGPEGTSLKDLPQKEVQAVLDKHASAFRLAEQAALRTHCDWGYPPPSLQNIIDLPLDDIQMNRELIRLLSLRCRLELAAGNFDAARKTLLTGLALARGVGNSNTSLIQDLVGIALANIMFSRVEEWMQVEGSPNLYWALSELPRPLIGVRSSIRTELNTIYRSFPALRDLKAKKLSPEEARLLLEKVFESFGKVIGEQQPRWKLEVGPAMIAMMYYPVAKKMLIAAGRSEKEVEALPVAQAVALCHLEEYDRVRDEVLKWLAVPPWQGYAELEKAEKIERQRAKETGNIIQSMLMPAIVKVYHAQVRTERYLAGLRTAEAIRLHIARHGRPPATLADVTEVPLPIDPFTGKGFDAWYKVHNDKAVLDVPPPPGHTIRLGKRFEFPIKGR